MTCTKRQVGCRSRPLLLPTSIYRQSVDGRSANRPGSLTSQNKNVGPKGHATHQAGKCYAVLFFLVLFVEGVHDQVVHGFQFSFILDSGEDALAVFFHTLEDAHFQLILLAHAGGDHGHVGLAVVFQGGENFQLVLGAVLVHDGDKIRTIVICHCLFLQSFLIALL